ncbi:MAG: homoserine O-acetyltransferase [Phycisphaeraceae bacterium]|nr:homoserine O-acetyltransferase [Phycisphaeraceae bacterium]
MVDDPFQSSDSQRSGRPLLHAQYATFKEGMVLKAGGRLPRVTVAYETYGTLNADKSNAVLIGHALSGDSHVARHDESDDLGWWDVAVGPGKAIDTDRWFVICSNLLGGCRGTTGPGSVNPDTPEPGEPFGRDFPTVSMEDMVDLQRMLIDHLGIAQLHAVVGGSLGGHQALCWATRYPDRVAHCVVLASSAHLTSQALAFDVVGRNAIQRDPHFHGGDYYQQPTKPDVGLALARMLGHITYLSPQAMAEKFEADKYRPRDIATEFEKRFSVGSYLAHQGHKFVERFDANSYMTLTLAMDLFDLGSSPQALRESLGKATCRWLIVSFSSDWLFPDYQSREIVHALLASRQSVRYVNVTSACGHDAFLLEDDLDTYGRLISGFLEPPECVCATAEASEPAGSLRTSIFDQKRIDYDLMFDLIPPGASVLDLGCGCGQLLARLAQREHGRLVGVELDEASLVRCVSKGLDVIHADLNHGLPQFADGQFDVVVLSQTLQSIIKTEAMVKEILRVGRRCVVSFANFAYRGIREALCERGRSPVAVRGLLHHQWYDTPNRRFLSVADWEEFCQSRDIRIQQRVFLDTETGRHVADDPNLNADLAIFVISR